MTTIQSIYDDFISVYNSQHSIIADSAVLFENRVHHEECFFSVSMHNAIIEYCFIQIFLAWENFLEKSFIAYLQNAADLKGVTYSRYGAPTDNEHAYNMIKGTKNYPDWTNINDVIFLSKTYFEGAGPYYILADPPPEIEAIKTIRNRISHVSEKSAKQFDRLLANNISRTGIGVGDYLMLFKDGRRTYFTYYGEYLKDYVDAICNAN